MIFWKIKAVKIIRNRNRFWNLNHVKITEALERNNCINDKLEWRICFAREVRHRKQPFEPQRIKIAFLYKRVKNPLFFQILVDNGRSACFRFSYIFPLECLHLFLKAKIL